MAKRHGLGRGLGALIRDDVAEGNQAPNADSGIATIPLENIRKGQWQPRHAFEEASLNELTESIRQHGVLQPLLLRKAGDGFELIAGERRFRAAQLAGLPVVPAIVLEAADQTALELALTENLQREDLNPMEEAAGYQLLADRFELTQGRIAERVGKARATVANSMRLLALPENIQVMVRNGTLSAGHAKVLTGLENPEEQNLLARRAVQQGLSVRALEKEVTRLHKAPQQPRVSQTDMPAQHISYLSDRLHAHFGTGVRITPSRTYANGKKSKGKLEIDFYSNEELDRILEVLGLSEE